MAEYIATDFIRMMMTPTSEEESTDELVDVMLEIKESVEGKYPDMISHDQIDDVLKGQRLEWLRERALETIEYRHLQLTNRREQMIAQEMGLDGTVPQPAQYQQQPTQQQPTVSLWYLLMGIAGAVVLGVLVGYALAWFHSQGSEENDGRDE